MSQTVSLPDFSSMIFDLERADLRLSQIARRTGIPPSTLSSWKNGVVDPSFSKGVALLDFYVQHCGTNIPRLVDREGARS